MPDTAHRLLLLRHGETQWSRSGRHTGRTDVPLTEAGERMAAAWSARFAAERFALVLASPLRRAWRTAELAGLTPLVEEDLVEWDYGGYEGRTTEQIRADGRPGWDVFADGVVPGQTPGETVEEVAARASRVLARVMPELEHGDVVLVGHGHTLRILAATYLRREPRFAAQLLLDPAHLGVLTTLRGVPVVERWNAT